MKFEDRAACVSSCRPTEQQRLKLTHGKTKAILHKGNVDKIVRHKEALQKIIKAVEELKIQCEKKKLQHGESLKNVQTWGAEIEREIDEADGEISYLKKLNFPGGYSPDGEM